MTQDCRLNPERAVPGSSACVAEAERRRARTTRRLQSDELGNEYAWAGARMARAEAAVGFESARGKWLIQGWRNADLIMRAARVER
jgi:hypothetical protein